MSVAYQVYINEYWFSTLYDVETYSDRPEPYRRHERALWILYQVVKAGGNRVAIVDASGQLVAELESSAEASAWVSAVYPEFHGQLTQAVYTKFSHSRDKLPPQA